MDWNEFAAPKPKVDRVGTLLSEAKEIGVSPWNPITEPCGSATTDPTKQRLTDIPFTYARHLDSALESSKINFYHANPTLLAKNHPGLDPQAMNPISKGMVNGIIILSWMYNHITGLLWSRGGLDEYPFDATIRVVTDALNLQLAVLPPVLKCHPGNTPDFRMGILSRSSQLRSSHRLKQLIFQVHRAIFLGGQLFKGYFKWSRLPGWKFYKDLIVVENFPGGASTFPFTFLLSVLDKIEAKFSMDLFLEVSNGSWDKRGSSFAELTRRVYKILDQAYNKAGNNAVDLFKGLETLALGAVLRSLPPDRNDHNFLPRAIRSLTEAVPMLTGAILDIATLFVYYVDSNGVDGIFHVLENYGQEKMHYFPIVESHEGLLKMYRIGAGYRYVDSSTVNDAVGMFILMYVTQYKAMQGVLPPIHLFSGVDKRILRIYRNGDLPSFSECLKIPLVVWGSITFRAHQVFDYVENELGLLDDKGISPRVSKWRQCFHSDSLSALGEQIERNPDETRLIMDMLRKVNIDVKAYFEECEQLGVIPYEWRLIRLKLKERELKLIARAFSILHPNTRHMASVAERNISNCILKFFTQQSMTKTGVELKKVIDMINSKMRPGNSSWVAIVLDLYQWNYTFRPELQLPFAQVLNAIFGVQHFTTLQRLFRDAVLISADIFCPPGLTNDFVAWIHHAGGNQGTFQKFWTIITLVLIKLVMVEMGLNHYMTGAGDNQVVIFDTAGYDNPGAIVVAVKQRLSEVFESVGLKMKPEETWYSDKLFNYQRKYYFEGSPVSTGLKQVVRAFAEGSEGSMGINNVVSTAMNTGVAVSSVVGDPLTGPIIAYMEAYTHLIADKRWKLSAPLSDKSLSLLSCLNTEIGYLPFMQLHGFFYSGHADNVTESLALLRKIWETRPDYRSIITGALSFRPEPYSADVALRLVLDPMSLPTSSHGSPEAFIRGEIEQFLKTSPRVVNRRLKVVLSNLDEQIRKNLAFELMSIRPIHVSFLHEVLENHVVGQSYQVLNRFTKLGSLAREAEFDKKHKKEELEEDKNQGTFAHRVETLSRALLRRISTKMHPVTTSNKTFIETVARNCLGSTSDSSGKTYLGFVTKHSLHPDCTYSLRLFLTSWVAGLLPELILGPFCPSAWEQLSWNVGSKGLRVGDSLMVALVGIHGKTPKEIHGVIGPLQLYRGTSTADSVRTTPLVNLKGSTERTNIRALLGLHTWAIALGSSSGLVDLLERMLNLRLPSCAKELIQLQPKKGGGSLAHRFHGPGEDRGSYINSASCMSSYVKLSSNFLHKYSEGKIDYNIFFQKIYNSIIYTLALCESPDVQFTVRIREECCTREVPNPTFKVDHTKLRRTTVVPEGFALPVHLEQSIVKELEHRGSFNLLELPDGCSPASAVGAYLGHQLGQQLYYHEKGLSGSDLVPDTSDRFSIQYNTSHFREVPMNLLLQCVGYALCKQNFLQCNRSLSQLKDRLSQLTELTTIPVDVGPFSKFLMALVESGSTRSMLRMSKYQPGYLSKNIIKQLFRPFLSAILHSLDTSYPSPIRPAVLFEQKHQSQDLGYAARFLKVNSSAHDLMAKARRSISPRQLLEKKCPILSPFVPVLTPDVESILSLARQFTTALDKEGLDDQESTLTIIPDIRLLPHQSWSQRTPSLEVASPGEQPIPLYLVHAHKISKAGSKIPGARYKLLEIVTRFSLLTGEEKFLICLADGGGSYAATLLHLCPQSSMIFNTLSPPDTVRSEQLGNTLPAALLCEHISPSRVIDVSTTGVRFGDLTHEDTWKELFDCVIEHGEIPDLVTFDMESISSNYQKALSFLTEFILRTKTRKFMVKTFSTEKNTEVRNLLDQLNPFFKDCFIDKPGFSSYFSKEIFVVGLNRVDWNSNLRFPALDILNHQLMSRSSGSNYHPVAFNLIKQINWRRGLSLCHTLESVDQGDHGSGTPPVSRSLRAAFGQILSVVQVRSSKSYPMDISNQHMLIGDTAGKKLVWEDVINRILSIGSALRLWHLGFFPYLEVSNEARNLHQEDVFLETLQGLTGDVVSRRTVEDRYAILGAALITSSHQSWEEAMDLWSICLEVLKHYNHFFYRAVEGLEVEIRTGHALVAQLARREKRILNVDKWCMTYSATTSLLQSARDILSIKKIRLVGGDKENDKSLLVVGYPGENSDADSTTIYLSLDSLISNEPNADWNETLVILGESMDRPPRGYKYKILLRVPIYWGDRIIVSHLVMLRRVK